MNSKKLIVLVTLITVIGVTTALHCYDCDYIKRDDGQIEGDKYCKEDLSKAMSSTCEERESQEAFCVKFESQHEDYEIIRRHCSSAGSYKDECVSVDNYTEFSSGDGPGKVCSCKENRCNSATKVFGGLTLLPVIGFTSHLLFN